MLSNLLFSLEAVAPMFIVIFAGWWFKNKSVLSQQDAAAFNRFAFNWLCRVPCFGIWPTPIWAAPSMQSYWVFPFLRVSCLYAAAWLLACVLSGIGTNWSFCSGCLPQQLCPDGHGASHDA